MRSGLPDNWENGEHDAVLATQTRRLLQIAAEHSLAAECAFLEIPWFENTCISAVIFEPVKTGYVSALDMYNHLRAHASSLPRLLYILPVIKLPQSIAGQHDQEALEMLVIQAIAKGVQPFNS